MRRNPDKHNIEMELREGERQFSAVLESMGYAIVTADKDGFVTFMNPQAEVLTGWKRKYAHRKSLSEIFHLLGEGKNIITADYIADILRGREFSNLVDPPMLISKAGTSIPVDVCASAVKDEEENITGMVLVFRDISELKQREEILRQKQEAVRTLFVSSPAALMIIDMKLIVMECNQAALDLLRYSSNKEIVGKNLIDLVVNKDQPRVIAHAKEVLAQGLLKEAEYGWLTKDNEELTALTSASIIRDASGQPLYLIVTARDITKIKRSKQQFQLVFDNIKDGIIMVDQNFKILMANSGALRIFGRNSFSSLIGKSCYSELYDHEGICDNCPAREVFRTGKPYDISKIYSKNSNEIIVLDISSLPIMDANGKVTEAIVFKRDATDRIRLENQLISRERMVVLGELASGIAHEIRNPLGNISASAQFCLSKYRLPKDAKKYLNIVLKNSENANGVIKDLLNFAKPRTVSFSMAEIGKVINASCDLVRANCLNHRVRFICRLPRELPRILLDKERLIEVFTNILLNAVDAMPNGGKLTVTAYSDFQNNQVVVSFLDTGKGIPEENLNKVFNPFFTTREDGIGLGLCLALQVINDHSGKINIESKIDHGTEVIVRLPISRV